MELTTPDHFGMKEIMDISYMKEVLVELTLGWYPLMTGVFVARIADKFILGLDVLYAHDACMNF
jgi:hypothetical protein